MLGCVLHDLCFVWPSKCHNINLHIFVALCDRPIDQAMLTWTEDRITVVINAVYLPGGRVLSHVPGVRLREYLSSLPPPKVAVGRGAARGADAVRAPPSDRAKFLADHPWVMEHLDVGREILGRRRRPFEGGTTPRVQTLTRYMKGRPKTWPLRSLLPWRMRGAKLQRVL